MCLSVICNNLVYTSKSVVVALSGLLHGICCLSGLLPDRINLLFYFFNLLRVSSSLMVWDLRQQFVNLLLVLPVVGKEVADH